MKKLKPLRSIHKSSSKFLCKVYSRRETSRFVNRYLLQWTKRMNSIGRSHPSTSARLPLWIYLKTIRSVRMRLSRSSRNLMIRLEIVIQLMDKQVLNLTSLCSLSHRLTMASRRRWSVVLWRWRIQSWRMRMTLIQHLPLRSMKVALKRYRLSMEIIKGLQNVHKLRQRMWAATVNLALKSKIHWSFRAKNSAQSKTFKRSKKIEKATRN